MATNAGFFGTSEKTSNPPSFSFGTSQTPSKSTGLLFGEQCVLRYGEDESRIQRDLVSKASVVLDQLLKNSTRHRGFGTPIANINNANPEIVKAVVQFMQNSLFQPFSISRWVAEKGRLIDRLKRCAEVYVLAADLQMATLKSAALEQWMDTASTCTFGSVSASEIKDIVQYTFSKTMRRDSGLRVEVVKFAAAYNQKYLTLYDSVTTSPESAAKCKPRLYKQLFQYQSRFPELEDALTSEEPLAWELAKAYEQEMQDLTDTQDPKTSDK